ncbi:MAG: oxidoreductase [Rhodospirillaceae bacterium]|nr:MAG: oxidoreductase [Rhodospirillaceae bacterium]
MSGTVRISKPTKSAMQSGRAKTKRWLLEYEPSDRVETDALMGWSGSHDTDRQLNLWFATKEEAVAFAKAKGMNFAVVEPHDRTIRPKSYADNFAFTRIR